MTKTPAANANDPPEPPPGNPTPPAGGDNIEWTALRFAEALLANPRCDQLLRLGSSYSPEQIGDALATACWMVANGFTSRMTKIRQAAAQATQEPTQ